VAGARVLSVLAWLGGAAPAAVTGQTLPGSIDAGWQAYVAATEARVMRERGQSLCGRAAADRGDVFVEQVRMASAAGRVGVAGATVNHWRGLILVPAVSLDDVLSRLQNEPPDTRQEDVLSSAILEQRPGWLRVALRVHRTLVLSAVFDTEHEVTFQRHTASRASSWSAATKIVEVAGAGTPEERPKEPGEDRGLLWRWLAYWRYEQVEKGVLVECESLTLSRPVPTAVKLVAGPLMNRVARESMARTLVTFRERFAVPRPESMHPEGGVRRRTPGS
jgi:hypothetical protein